MLHSLRLSGKKLIGHRLLLGCAVGVLFIDCAGQTPATTNQPVGDSGIEATRAQMASLRDEFVKATVKAGFTCPIAPPTILVVDVPSFGNYDPESNTLKAACMGAVNGRVRGGASIDCSGLGQARCEAARAEFETGVHHWVFVHEMGHWWQACRGVVHPDKHYAVEFGANRIAAAYWQERDPQVVAHQRAVFEGLLKRSPRPIEEAQDVESYFDANYEKLGPTPVYIWFQAQMCIAAFDEKPVPTFAQALKQTTH